MALDPSIPLQAKNPQIDTGANRLAMMGEAMKIGEMQRGVETQNQLRQLYSQGIDVSTPEGFKQVAALDPATALKLRADALQGQKLQGDIRKTNVDIDQKTFDLAKQRMGDLAFNPSDSNIKAHLEDGLLRKEITPAQANATWQQVSALPLDQRKAYFTELGVKVEKRYEMSNISAAQQQANLTTIRGQDVSAQTTRRGQDLVDLRTREGQAMQYNPDLQARIAEAKASGEFMGKNKAAAAAALPGALEAAKEGIRLIDEMVGQAEVRDKSGKVITKGTKPHPGFSEYVGATLVPGKRFLEGTDVAGFEVRQKQIEGKAFLEAFQTLKGGGAITEKEGEKGTAAIMRMNKASNEKEYTAAARELQTVLRSGMERAQAKAGSVPAAPSGGGGGVVDYNSLK
jgi:hypothetical protein